MISYVTTVITLAIGLVTPPYGLCLLIASNIGGLSIERSFRSVIPFISVVLVVLLLVAFFRILYSLYQKSITLIYCS